MPRQVQLRRGTTADHESFTGAPGEITVDTDKNTVIVHDGATVGGFPLAREDSNAVVSDTIVRIVKLFQFEYEALTVDEIDANTLYIVLPNQIDLESGAITLNGFGMSIG